MRATYLLVIIGLLMAGCVRTDPLASLKQPPALRFVAFGDGPYGKSDTVDAPFRTLIQDINAQAPPLVVHVGDTHGHHSCDDQLLDQIRAYMNAIAAPVLYTPGDNEWTDCHTTPAGEFDPLDRLAYIRKTHFQTGKTLGQVQVPVQNQSRQGYPENARMSLNNIGFVTVHVVGSNNNFDPRDMNAVNEFMARNTADIAWLEDSFKAYKDMDAIVVALHADMFLGISGFRNGWRGHSPFRDIGVTLGRVSLEYGKPVLLLFGDSHVQRSFKPNPRGWPNLHAIEVFGHPDIKAIEIAVRPNARRPFVVSKVIGD